MDFSNTYTLMEIVKQRLPFATFLRDRYFPSNGMTDVFNTEEVIVEYKDDNQKIAPFVSPRKNGITVLREGYNIRTYAPANIAPRRPLTIDELNRKQMGESIYSQLTPAQRQVAILADDMAEMDKMIARREEAMAAETMLTNGCVMKHYADRGDKFEEHEIRFYDGVANPAKYTPAVKWDQNNMDFMGDLHEMIRMLTTKGLPATDVILGAKAAKTLVNSKAFKDIMDIKRYIVGEYNPTELGTGVAKLCTLNVMGHNVDLYTYDQTYTNDQNKNVPYIPAEKIVVTAPACGHTSYGCVTQLEQSDNQFHSYAGKRVPHYVADAANNSRSLTLTARPLLIPRNKNPWITADVCDPD